jgi:hypothetical protein
MAKINMKGLRREIARQYSVNFKKQLEKKILSDVDKVKKQMIAEFNSHSITKDVESGSNASNIPGGGSLFALIGFDAGDNPVDRLRAFLLNSLKVKITNISKSEVAFSFKLDIPSKEQMDIISPLPWAAGRSWLDEVERGVSGLGRFLSKQSYASRSGGGIQVDGNVRQSSLSGTPYITEIINNLIKNITSTLEIS